MEGELRPSPPLPSFPLPSSAQHRPPSTPTGFLPLHTTPSAGLSPRWHHEHLDINSLLRGCLMYRRTFRSIPALYLLDARSTTPPSGVAIKKMSPRIVNCLLGKWSSVKNHCFQPAPSPFISIRIFKIITTSNIYKSSL